MFFILFSFANAIKGKLELYDDKFTFFRDSNDFIRNPKLYRQEKFV